MNELPTQLKRIVSTGLVSADEVLSLVSTCDYGAAVTEHQVLNELIERGFISKWQASQISSGKFKGFIVGQYRILKLTRPGQNTYYAEALDTESGDYVLLEVSRYPTSTIRRLAILDEAYDATSHNVSDDARLRKT
jgi:hypothetical protein